ncbi:DUF3857 domain-containing protein [Dysgonomonas macrotermitis]|uniref:Transglutaminase-like enzyme, putative cysteine protease n=1 Tax=Dysgonomonas macrotermitis TaxID=1346286 RepID=A0A1M4TPS4_9BACT|nr:DUF3857 domain-containing protein [Dysgonomonas macrotermitis]SHE46395.1 Transglutaminase-like enzyme, putative cysteine protease [Dysgonomonas macrotermitis]
MKRYFKTIIILCYVFTVFMEAFGAEKQAYPVVTIADSLKKNANTVIRLNQEEFIQSDINKAIYKVTKVVTILNKQGEDYGNFTFTGDKFRELSSFSGIIRDAEGNITRKIKKGDLTTSTLSDDGLATGRVDMFYIYKSPSYPYTVEYEYEEKWKDGILSYPAFYPYDGYFQSVEKSTIKIEVPSSVILRKYVFGNLDMEEEKTSASTVYSSSSSSLPAISYEPLAPSFREIFPRVLMAPSDFCFDSYCGNMADWANYGLWVDKLLKGKDQLPPALIAQLEDMTRNAKTVREKVETVFDYMQKNTRYVSIQLGIGGYQPMDAMTVSKVKFSDCKGLTNYMYAMLKAIDIPSNYCVISTKEKRLFADYPNFNQADHVILLVPNGNDSIWLECTNQTLPFGYVHQKIAGHDAVVIGETGGAIARLPDYTDKQNKRESTLNLTVDGDGGVSGDVSTVEYLDGFEQSYSVMESDDRDRLVKYVNQSIPISKMQLGQIKTSLNKSAYPSSSMSVPFSAADFAAKTGSRLFIPLSPVRQASLNMLTAQTRVHDIEISQGFTDSVFVSINLPQGYAVELLPKDIMIETEFGIFVCKSENKEGQIIYSQTIDIYTGRYDKSKYADIKSFFTQITSALNRKMVLKQL